jgi:aminodeoxychorismate synthase component I
MRERLQTACAVREIGGSWLDRVSALRARRHSWWLDSALPEHRSARHSFAGADPYAVLSATGRRAGLDVQAPARPDLVPGRSVRTGPPLEVLADLLPPPLEADSVLGGGVTLPFRGGAVGYLGYELARELEPLARLAADPPRRGGWPDLCFLLVDRLIAHDHTSGRSFAVGLGFDRSEADARAAAERAAREIALATDAPDRVARAALADVAAPRSIARAHGSFDEGAHAKALAHIQDRIGEGDCYQACLTHRLELPLRGDAWRLHAALRAHNPAPFAAWLDLPDGQIVGSSPERFLRVRSDGRAESRPVKGTRPRHALASVDGASRDALARSEKDRAENLMIVDLVRNDLGRVCEAGSVHVPELMAIEEYATVFQMVSTVRGRLRPGVSVLDAVSATFPPGSMTGAPKLAAMQLLAALEKVARGPYAGALGYLDAGGGCDLCVVIRSAFVQAGRATVHTGGGIVADSVARDEWCEAEDKARALLAAVAAVEGA